MNARHNYMHMMFMKKWSYVFALGFSLIAFSLNGQEIADTWNHKIVVNSGVEDIDGDSLYAYSAIVFDVGDHNVRSVLIEELNAHTEEKVTRKKAIRALHVKLPEFSPDSVNILARLDEVGESDDVNVILSFTLAGQVVNPANTPEADNMTREAVYNLSVLLNQSVVTGEMNQAITDKSTLENKHLAFTNQLESLVRKLESAESKLADIEKENEDIAENLQNERSKEAELKTKAAASSSTKEDLQAYDASVEYVAKVEGQLLKNEQSRVSTAERIQQAKSSVQEKQKEIQTISAQLTDQEKFIAKLNLKRDAIK